MHETMAELNFDGDLATFFNHVRDGKWNYFPDTQAGRDAYISEATAAIVNIKTRLPDFFGLSPETDLIIKRVEAFRERDGRRPTLLPGNPRRISARHLLCPFIGHGSGSQKTN